MKYPQIIQIALASLPLLLSGCATPAKSTAMIPPGINPPRHHPHTVRITVGGGQETNPLLTSNISNEDFAQALAGAIAQSRLFSEVSNSGGAEYDLSVTILYVDQPVMGFNMTVEMRTYWQLTRSGNSSPLFHTTVISSYTATVGDAFAGLKRLRLANEGAARENIRDGLHQLAEVEI
jgi:hypothetical protein